MNGRPVDYIATRLALVLCIVLNACQEPPNTESPKIAYTDLLSGHASIYTMTGDAAPSIKSTEVKGGYLAWSPDGKKLAFYHKYDDRKTWSIHTMNADGSDRKRLTFAKNTWDYGPDWSPDGEQIVFARTYRDTLGVAHKEIWMMKADGSEQTRLEPLVGGSPFFTPDGRIVYSAEYANKKSEICIANSNGSGIVQLTDNEADEWHPDVSADGQYIAFMSDRDGNFEVYTMKIDGSDAKRLTHDEVDNWYPSWSADGAKLMYSIKTGEERKDRDIYIMDADGASVEKIISKGSQAAWMK
ncbi:DUF5050 domain-containing protein [Flagellimonas sp. DF-77]